MRKKYIWKRWNKFTSSVNDFRLRNVICRTIHRKSWNSKVKSAYEPTGSSDRSLSRFQLRLGVFLLPPEWGVSPSKGYLTPPPSLNFARTHLYTWVEICTVRVKCLVQEHNTISLARARTRTAHSGVKCTNHEAIVSSLPSWNTREN